MHTLRVVIFWRRHIIGALFGFKQDLLSFSLFSNKTTMWNICQEEGRGHQMAAKKEIDRRWEDSNRRPSCPKAATLSVWPCRWRKAISRVTRIYSCAVCICPSLELQPYLGKVTTQGFTCQNCNLYAGQSGHISYFNLRVKFVPPRKWKNSLVWLKDTAREQTSSYITSEPYQNYSVSSKPFGIATQMTFWDLVCIALKRGPSCMDTFVPTYWMAH